MTDIPSVSYPDTVFPVPHIKRFLTDRSYAEMRMEQAQAWILDDRQHYAPQDPRAIMVELLAYVKVGIGR